MTYSQQIQQLNVIDKTEQTYRFLIKSEKEEKKRSEMTNGLSTR